MAQCTIRLRTSAFQRSHELCPVRAHGAVHHGTVHYGILYRSIEMALLYYYPSTHPPRSNQPKHSTVCMCVCLSVTAHVTAHYRWQQSVGLHACIARTQDLAPVYQHAMRKSARLALQAAREGRAVNAAEQGPDHVPVTPIAAKGDTPSDPVFSASRRLGLCFREGLPNT